MMHVISQKTFTGDDDVYVAQIWACQKYLKNPDLIPVIITLDCEVSYYQSSKDLECAHKILNTVIFGSYQIKKVDIEKFIKSFLNSKQCSLTNQALRHFRKDKKGTDFSQSGSLGFICHHVILLGDKQTECIA